MLNEKQIAQGWAKENVELEKLVDTGIGELRIWRTSDSIPTIRFGTFSDLDGNIAIPNADRNIFQSVIVAIYKKSQDEELICELYKKLNGALVTVLTKLPPYLMQIEDRWAPPVIEDNSMSFFIENLTQGFVNKVVITREEVVESEVCKGNEFALK